MHPINFPVLGNSLVMAVVILPHVFFAFVAVGGIALACAGELIGYKKKDDLYDRFAREYVGFLSDMMKLGGVLGATFVVLLIGLFPEFAKILYNIFFWPLVLEAGLFFLLGASTIYYRATWETARGKPRHIFAGALASLSAVAAAVVINAAWSFMLTPGKYFESPSLAAAFFNPAMAASSTHILIACVANAAAFAFLYALYKERRLPGDRYYPWLADHAGGVFASAILLQPLSGLSFLLKLRSVNEAAYANITGGIASGFFWTMAGLGITAVISSVIYLASRRRLKGALLVGSLAALTAFFFGAYTRERARKPYLIYGYLYMNGALARQPAGTAPGTAVQKVPVEKAAARPAPSVKISSGTKPSGKTMAAEPSGAAARPAKPSASAMLDEYSCLVCHKYKGSGGTFGPELDEHLKHHSKDELKKILKNPAPAMPPFEGTDAQLETLVDALKD